MYVCMYVCECASVCMCVVCVWCVCVVCVVCVCVCVCVCECVCVTSLAYHSILTVLHELCQVEHSLSDLWDVLLGECLLQVTHQVLLVDGTQLHPARHKRSIKQFPRIKQANKKGKKKKRKKKKRRKSNNAFILLCSTDR